MFDNACTDLFYQIRSSRHCLHAILPSVTIRYDMHQRDHTFVLLLCSVVVNF